MNVNQGRPHYEASASFVARCVTATVALGFALYWLRPLLIPFVVATFLSYGLAPLVDLLEKKLRLPRAAAVILSLLVGAGLFTGLGLLFVVSGQQVAERAPEYETQLRTLADQGVETLRDWGFDLGPHPIRDQLTDLPIRQWLGTATSRVFGILSTGFLVIVFLIYLVAGQSKVPRGEDVPARVQRRIRRYLLVQTAISGSVGLATALILWALGVPLALAFGLLAFVLDFIPNVGSLFAGTLPVALMLLSPDIALWQAGVGAAALAAIHLTAGNFITPKVMGDSLRLHPITVLLALIFWGMLWGLVGALLAAPLTATLKILLEESEHLRPVARLMGGNREEPAEAS